MKRIKQLIEIMFISILISFSVILLLELGVFAEVRRAFVQKIVWFQGKREIICNIFIGILGSSIIALIGYIIDYFYELKEGRENIINLYRRARLEIIPIIGLESDEYINEVETQKDIIQKIEKMLEDYMKRLQRYNKLLQTKWLQEKKVNIFDLSFCPKHIKAVYVLWKVHDYYSFISTNYMARCILYDSYTKMYLDLKKSGMDKNKIKEALMLTFEYYKYYSRNKKIFKHHIIEINLLDKCKQLDIDLRINIVKR